MPGNLQVRQAPLAAQREVWPLGQRRAPALFLEQEAWRAGHPRSVLGGHFLKGTWACVEKRKDDAENTAQGTAEATKRTFPPLQWRGGTE